MTKEFAKKWGNGSLIRTLNEKELLAFKKKLPGIFYNEVKHNGLRMYMDGLFWFIDPNEYAKVLSEWRGFPKGYVPFARTSFGNLFLLSKSHLAQFHIHYNALTDLGTSDILELFLDSSLTSDYFIDKGLARKTHTKLIKKWGQLQPDESWAYIPALAMGGEESDKNIKKVKYLVQLSILSQLSTGINYPNGEF